MSDIYIKYRELAKCYNMNSSDARKLWKMIDRIATHPEFIKRCDNPYFHHDIKTLGEHILCDAIVTYKLSKKIKKKSEMKKINTEVAVVIAMFHDLYELPWQNNPIKKIMRNKHGFTHPIEAVVNAITWFPDYFISKERAIVIIDGILHHMYPLPVRAIDSADMELNNKEKYDNLKDIYKKMIKLSTDAGKMGHYSLRKSFFIEGRILSRADKYVAFRKDVSSIHGFTALISGKNKNIK